MAKTTPYDFAAWRRRMKIESHVEAAAMLGCSRSHFWKMESEGVGAVMAVWACYGLECARNNQIQQKG